MVASYLRGLSKAIESSTAGTGPPTLRSPAETLLRSYGLNDAQIHEVHVLYQAGAGAAGADDSSFAKFDKTQDFVYLGAAILCVCCAALAAGLTLGLVSMDPLEMELKARAGTPKEKMWARKVRPLIKRHHLLLVTLLLFNATANEALPLFLDGLLPQWAAVVISVTMVLLFGEILPSAVMTGPKQLQLSAAMSTPTWCLIFLFFPVSYPLSVCLDKLLGHEDLRTYTRTELAELVKVQHETCEEKHQKKKLKEQLSRTMSSQSDISTGGESESKLDAPVELPPKAMSAPINGRERRPLPSLGRSMRSLSARGSMGIREEEAVMLSSILSNAHTTVDRIMVPIADVFLRDRDDVLTPGLRKELSAAGFSRIPLCACNERSNIRGFIHIKSLIDVDLGGENKKVMRLRDLPVLEPLVVGKSCELLVMLDKFKAGRSHLALVAEDPMATRVSLQRGLPLRDSSAILGIVTMEDVIEDLLMQDIQDEADHLRRGDQSILRTNTLRVPPPMTKTITY